MRRLVATGLFLAAAALVAGCLWPWEEGRIEETGSRPVFHLDGNVSFTDRYCGDCHYGLTEMWDASWTPLPDAANATQWRLDVSPRYPEAPLYAVQVADGEPAVRWQSGVLEREWLVSEPWEVEFEVPEDAGVFARVHAEALSPEADATRTWPTNYTTGLELVAPDGSVIRAAGPDHDLKMLTIPDAAAGTWTFRAELAGGDRPRALGVAWIEALGGEVREELAWAETASHRFAAGPDGAPPDNVSLRLRPYHQHLPYENMDWDRYDASPFAVAYAPRAGPEPAVRSWNTSAIDALWDGRDTIQVLDRSGTRLGVYLDEPGHNDPGYGGSYPSFGPLGKPVPPGTSEVHVELTWTPAVDLDTGIRFSPANTPYFYDAEAAERQPGRALFAIPVPSAWWDNPEGIHHPALQSDEPIGAWDLAPHLRAQPGEPVVESWEWYMGVVAVRG